MDYINQIINDDCLKVLPLIDDESVDLIISSPPLDYFSNPDFDCLHWGPYWDWVTKWLIESYRILKNDRLIILFYPFKHEQKKLFTPIVELYNICYDLGFSPYQLKLINTGGICFVASKGDPHKFGIKESIVTLEYMKENIESWREGFIEKILETTTEMGYLILDPFCGEGKACLAAKKLERNFIGIDINKKLCEKAEIWVNIK